MNVRLLRVLTSSRACRERLRRTRRGWALGPRNTHVPKNSGSTKEERGESVSDSRLVSQTDRAAGPRAPRSRVSTLYSNLAGNHARTQTSQTRSGLRPWVRGLSALEVLRTLSFPLSSCASHAHPDPVGRFFDRVYM